MNSLYNKKIIQERRTYIKHWQHTKSMFPVISCIFSSVNVLTSWTMWTQDKKNRHKVQSSERNKFIARRRILMLPLSRTTKSAVTMSMWSYASASQAWRMLENPPKRPISINYDSGYINNSQGHSSLILMDTSLQPD